MLYIHLDCVPPFNEPVVNSLIGSLLARTLSLSLKIKRKLYNEACLLPGGLLLVAGQLTLNAQQASKQ
jgi:hypothetical protein